MSRRVVIYAVGSRGDIQPGVALGRELTKRGDKVRVVAVSRYEDLVASAGLELSAISADPTQIAESDELQEWLAGGRNPVKFVRNFKKILGPLAERMLAETYAACTDADLLITPTMGFLGEHLGARLGIPWALVHFQPSQPTRAFPHPLIPQAGLLGKPGNRLSYELMELMAWQLLRPFINPWRRSALDLPKLPPRGPAPRARRDRRPVLCAFSPTVVPRPADWPSYVHMHGYWFLDAAPGWTPPAELESFLAAGPPPVYVGFGSMVPKDPAATGEMIVAALRAAGARGVVHGVDPGLAGDDLMVVDDVPHTWLFPKMAAVVHHGGAGTTAAGLRAGVPSLVCHFFGDQPYWGERVAALDAGPAPLPFKELTAERLAAGIRTATETPGLRAAARSLGKRIRAEDGIAAARTVLDDLC
ncbi:glycosyltransferase [Actinomadura craniellae]|uniref:Glycosyltransferase n=1 Tax=Actinomadura craniellae TaxID=2231787 RepID=A0A365GWR5_9ACTN|nr:glycosyltransferase [Actinomadura craniellae]RAY11265.1 glycosyltransferase [Actinomadura craniellae]